MHVAHGMQQPSHLFLTGFDDLRVRMAGGGDAKGRRQIQIFFSVDIPNVRLPGAVPDDGPRAIRLPEDDVA
jgi:hypothetical protein